MSHKKHLIALAALLLARAAFAETVNYNVFVKLDNTAESRVNDISQALARQGVNSLFAQGYQVHLTLYLTEYDSKRLPEIQKIVSQFCPPAKQIHHFVHRDAQHRRQMADAGQPTLA